MADRREKSWSEQALQWVPLITFLAGILGTGWLTYSSLHSQIFETRERLQNEQARSKDVDHALQAEIASLREILTKLRVEVAGEISRKRRFDD